MKNGWKLVEIDEMDIHFFFELMKYASKNGKKEQQAYIDQVL